MTKCGASPRPWSPQPFLKAAEEAGAQVVGPLEAVDKMRRAYLSPALDQLNEVLDAHRACWPKIEDAFALVRDLYSPWESRRDLEASLGLLNSDPLRGLVGDQGAALSAIQSLFADVARHWADAFKFPPLPFPRIEDLREQQREEVQLFGALAAGGWLMPAVSAAEIPELLELHNSEGPRAVDQAILRRYDENDQEEWKELRRQLLKRKLLSPWRDHLREAIHSYEDRRYKLIPATLMMILDGVVSKRLGLWSKGDPGHLSAKTLERHSREPQLGTHALVEWHAANRFFGSVWMRASFGNKKRPAVFNRHWLLHGRDGGAGRRADALRLFVALDTVADMLRWIVPARKRKNQS